MNFFLSITELYCINYCCTAKWLSYTYKVKVKVKSLKSRQTLCDPMDCSPPGSSIHGILQTRTLEWVAISFSRGSSWPRDRTRVSRVVGRCFTIWATREVHTYIWVYIYIHILFHILFNYGLSQESEYSFPCYTGGPCCLSILCVPVCICWSQMPTPSLHQGPPLWQPPVCFQCPWFCFCFINRLLCVIF